MIVGCNAPGMPVLRNDGAGLFAPVLELNLDAVEASDLVVADFDGDVW